MTRSEKLHEWLEANAAKVSPGAYGPGTTTYEIPEEKRVEWNAMMAEAVEQGITGESNA